MVFIELFSHNPEIIKLPAGTAHFRSERAPSFVDELEAKCLRLGQVSGIGTARPELGDGLRMLPHGNYLIFYRDHERGLRIERVMHGARDIGGDALDADR